MLQRTINIVVPGLPKGKAAARHTSRGFTYTPAETKHYMSKITEAARQAGAVSKDCPCSMSIRALFPIPESHSQKRKQEITQGKVYYSKKPDTDNLSKIKDALKGVAFKDDALVWRESIAKYYSANPRLEITITYHDSPDPLVLGYMP